MEVSALHVLATSSLVPTSWVVPHSWPVSGGEEKAPGHAGNTTPATQSLY
jgi:hypothetical protein